MKIKLTEFECRMAITIAVERCINSTFDGRKDNHGYDGSDSWDVNIEGACAELAVAKAINKYWPGGVNTFKAPDLEDIQVRWTPRKDGHLIVRKGDPDNDKFVLVIGKMPDYEVVGWIKGSDAKQERYLKNWGGRVPCYGVPQINLKPLNKTK